MELLVGALGVVCLVLSVCLALVAVMALSHASRVSRDMSEVARSSQLLPEVRRRQQAARPEPPREEETMRIQDPPAESPRPRVQRLEDLYVERGDV